jgi:hypothetical protein
MKRTVNKYLNKQILHQFNWLEDGGSIFPQNLVPAYQTLQCNNTERHDTNLYSCGWQTGGLQSCSGQDDKGNE